MGGLLRRKNQRQLGTPFPQAGHCCSGLGIKGWV